MGFKRMIKKTIEVALILIIVQLFLANMVSADGAGVLKAEKSLIPTSMLLTSQPFSKFDQKVLFNENKEVPPWTDEFQKPSGRKSITKAMLLSLVLPGVGEYYAGNKSRFRLFLGIEGAVWSGFFGFRTYGSWKKKDYKGFAALHAGVDLEGKSDEYFENMTYYDSRDEYNQFAKLYHGDNAMIYPENDFWNWEWDNQHSKSHFRKLRNQSKSAYRKAL